MTGQKGCFEKTVEAAGVGAFAGLSFGAISGAWAAPPVSQDGKGFAAARSVTSEFPQVVKLMGRNAAAFSAVCGVFAMGDCFSEVSCCIVLFLLLLLLLLQHCVVAVVAVVGFSWLGAMLKGQC